MKKRNKSIQCGNCGWTFKEANNFCPSCGQENHHYHAPFKEVFWELLEGLFHFDTKFWNTAKAMVLKPGLISKDYFENKRARYVPPIRLYVFISVVYFFTLKILMNVKEGNVVNDRQVVMDLQTPNGEKISDEKYKQIVSFTPAQLDSFFIANNIVGSFEKYVFHKQVKINTLNNSGEKLISLLYRNISYSLFLMMPVFAVILMWVFRKSNKYYADYLIFSIHFHSAMFVLLFFVRLLSVFSVGYLSETIGNISLLLMVVYLYFSLRTCFQQKHKLFRTLIITLCYMVFVTIIFVIDVVIALIML